MNLPIDIENIIFDYLLKDGSNVKYYDEQEIKKYKIKDDILNLKNNNNKFKLLLHFSKCGFDFMPKPLIYNNKKKCEYCEKYKITKHQYKFCFDCLKNFSSCKRKNCNKKVIYLNEYTNKGYCSKNCYVNSITETDDEDETFIL